MNFEKIEEAYDLLLENVQNIQNRLGTNIYDALIEQNAAYSSGSEDELIHGNNLRLKKLNLTKEEWRRSFQFLLIKANQTEPMQYNHQFTPDSIGFLMTFLLDELVQEEAISVLEIGSGTGNLAQTILNHSQKKLDYLGIEVDDLLIDLSASTAEVMGANIGFAQGDAVRPQILKESQVIISDLPIGFYPDDAIAKRYQVASQEEYTYAHHLLMEQSLKYLKQDGYAIFLAPNDLLTSQQSPLLKKWLKEQASVLAMITLPTNLFGNQSMAKSILVLQKKQDAGIEAFVYPLHDLQSGEHLQAFVADFKKWKAEHAI
ncbi:adenine-specific DNA methylase [Streptococcus varani]|uniref:Adenine-specific DNA methylase n=1 Tax=Streptococcus varani TaxID=1608583 RepID=A0A0E4CRX8_9STRE|nr:class I SAM-dependent methyltransferase [Streptococcus varani]CQR23996.1 adenine-specific DNA methylase [Streptococcus varani]